MIQKTEFEKSLYYPIAYWQSKSIQDVQDALGTHVSRMVNYNQNNPHHCYDLFTHTLFTVNGIPKTTDHLLRIAAFFHDIGKPEVAFIKRNRTVFYGHAEQSASIAEVILTQLGYTSEEITKICFYIKYHDTFISWESTDSAIKFHKTNYILINKHNLYKKIEKIAQKEYFLKESNNEIYYWKNLLVLCYSDASAQSTEVFVDNILIDTKNHKQEKIQLLYRLLDDYSN